MTSKFFRKAALAAAIALAAAPAFAGTLSGPYTVSYLSGPSHTLTATQCLVFTNTGGILGFPNSGTWTATTFSGYGGNFVVDGADARFYGTFGGGTGIIPQHVGYKASGTMKGGFDDFTGSSGGANASNDGRVKLAPGCAAAHMVAPRSGVSPTR